MERYPAYVSRKNKEKLIKWYGWIFILLVCMTPLVIIVLPKLMVNVNRINQLLKESIVPETDSVQGVIKKITWNKTYDGDLGWVDGDIELSVLDNEIKCKFKRYIGPKYNQLINITSDDQVRIAGKFNDNVFFIRTIENLNNNNVYTTEPMVSVY